MFDLRLPLIASLTGLALGAGAMYFAQQAHWQHKYTTLELAHAQLEADRNQLAAQAQSQDAQAVADHSNRSTDNALQYIESLQRAADTARTDADRADRLRRAAEARRASTGDLSQASADTIRHLLDRCHRLDAHIAEGAAVVGDFRGLVIKRDAQVRALQQQIQADRELFDRAH